MTTLFQTTSIQQAPPTKCHCADYSDILVVDDNVFNIVTLQAILELKFNT